MGPPKLPSILIIISYFLEHQKQAICLPHVVSRLQKPKSCLVYMARKRTPVSRKLSQITQKCIHSTPEPEPLHTDFIYIFRYFGSKKIHNHAEKVVETTDESIAPALREIASDCRVTLYKITSYDSAHAVVKTPGGGVASSILTSQTESPPKTLGYPQGYHQGSCNKASKNTRLTYYRLELRRPGSHAWTGKENANPFNLLHVFHSILKAGRVKRYKLCPCTGYFSSIYRQDYKIINKFLRFFPWQQYGTMADALVTEDSCLGPSCRNLPVHAFYNWVTTMLHHLQTDDVRIGNKGNIFFKHFSISPISFFFPCMNDLSPGVYFSYNPLLDHYTHYEDLKVVNFDPTLSYLACTFAGCPVKYDGVYHHICLAPANEDRHTHLTLERKWRVLDTVSESLAGFRDSAIGPCTCSKCLARRHSEGNCKHCVRENDLDECWSDDDDIFGF